MKMCKEARRHIVYYILGEILFGICLPFQRIRIRIRSWKYERNRAAAIKKADYEAELLHKKHYVVCNGGEFHVYNKGGLLNLCKALKKKYGYTRTWKDLYIYETK